MREIKFRAWDKVRGRMQCDVYIEPGDLQVGSVNEAFNDPCYRFMQYTGLKDKNGVEIYEGDIVQFDKDDPLTAEPVTFNTDTASFETPTDIIDKGFYVVGNIYQNPELLERKHDS